MKRIKIIVVVLLAAVLLLIPSMALADNPDGGVEVDIGIISGGDVDVDLGIEAGGDVSIDVGTNAGVNVNGDNLVNTSVLDNALANSRGDGDEWSYYQVRINKRDIEALWQLVGNDMTHDIWLISGAVAKNIREDAWQGVSIGKNNAFTEGNARGIISNTTQIAYLAEMDAWLVDYDAVLAGEIDATNVRIAQLEATIEQNEARANSRLLIVVGIALVVLVLLGIANGRLRRKISTYL